MPIPTPDFAGVEGTHRSMTPYKKGTVTEITFCEDLKENYY